MPYTHDKPAMRCRSASEKAVYDDNRILPTRRRVLAGLATLPAAAIPATAAPASRPDDHGRRGAEDRRAVLLRNLDHHLCAAALCLNELTDGEASSWLVNMEGEAATWRLNYRVSTLSPKPLSDPDGEPWFAWATIAERGA